MQAFLRKPPPAKSPLTNIADQVGSPVTVEVSAVKDLGGLLYAPGELVTTDHNFIVSKRPIPQPRDGMPYARGNSVIDIFGAKITSSTYQVDALVTPPPIRLRSLLWLSGLDPPALPDLTHYPARPGHLPGAGADQGCLQPLRQSCRH